MKTLKNLFLDELADMYDAEHRIIKALPKLAKAATCEDLKAAFQSHLKQTEGQVKRLEQVFQAFGEKAKGKKCEATVGLLKEGDEIAAEFKGSPSINAALISAAQKVEHYEMASYGCLHEWAGLLGNRKAADLLQETLTEETDTNRSLTDLARASSNEEALSDTDTASSEAAEAKTSGNLARGNRPASSQPKRQAALRR
ncbi:MAG TPA: ferritin-like domain-containing protein [Candidatus Eisenbacteria bacterium]|nr:ferritin-like domain-containing protein [Candidatus Eisenbacteria bacterium]